MTIHAPRLAVAAALLLACTPAAARPPQSETLTAPQRQAADVFVAFYAALRRDDAAFAKALRRSVTRTSSHALGDLAWIATESTSKGAYKGKPIDSVGTETMILRRSGGTWRIAHVHWSSAARGREENARGVRDRRIAVV